MATATATKGPRIIKASEANVEPLKSAFNDYLDSVESAEPIQGDEIPDEVEAATKSASQESPKPMRQLTPEELQTLFELQTKSDMAELATLQAKERAKEAKEGFDCALIELKNYVRFLRDGEKKDYPLFDHADRSNDKTFDTSTIPPKENEPWRGVLLESLFPAATYKALSNGGLETVGDMADFSAADKKLTDLKGIGPEKANQIEARMVQFWSENTDPKD